LKKRQLILKGLNATADRVIGLSDTSMQKFKLAFKIQQLIEFGIDSNFT
jgi:hypothetical protein